MKISGEKEKTRKTKIKIPEAEVGRLKSRKGKQQKKRVVQAKQMKHIGRNSTFGIES